MNPYEDSILRVLKGDLVVGAAFLVSDRLVATCAHVVGSAGSKVGGKILLRSSDDKDIEASVERDFWRDPNAEDISILRLNEPLENLQPVILGSSTGTKGHAFSTFGFPKQEQELAGGGEIIGQATINSIKVLQLRSSEVTPGFSGAPIFDEITKRVVGMVVAITPPDEYQRLGTTAFAIPSETIRETCSDLQISDICPYRSLDVFHEEDASFFFGRESVVQKMLDSLKREPRFLAVLGPSGSGKSSVVRAGLVPALREGKVLGSEQWNVITFRPANQPFQQMESAGLSNSQSGLETAVHTWIKEHPQKTRLILVIDQFEEIFVSTPEDIRQQFTKGLANLLNSPITITTVLALRDDFYSRFLKDATALTGWLERGLVNIPTILEEDEVRATIIEPAKALGLKFEEGLLDHIVSDAVQVDRTTDKVRSTTLPLLEFALTELWKKRHDGQLTHEAYRAIGGVTGGLTQWADRAYYSLDKSDQLVAQNILTTLVHLGDTDQNLPDSRRTVFLDELSLAARNQTDTSKLIKSLVDARLLVTGRTSQGEYVELIHDAIVQQWGLLNDWLIEDRQFLSWRQKLQVNYRDWNAGKGDVLRGLALDEAEKWLTDYGSKLNVNEKKYIQESMLVRNEHEKKIKRTELLSLIPYLLIVFVVGMFAIYVSTRLVSSSLEERLSNQLLEAGRVVSDSMSRKDIDQLRDARLVAFTRGLGEALKVGDVNQITTLAKPAAGGLNAENLMVFDYQGHQVLHTIKQSNGDIQDVTLIGAVSETSIVDNLLVENNPDSLPRRILAMDKVDGRYYYFTSIPIPLENEVVGVVVVGTSLNTLAPLLKSTASADIIIYEGNGQALATTLGTGATDPLFLRTITIEMDFYNRVVNQDDIVEGEYFEVDRRSYRSGFAPLKISDDRIAVFAVILPMQFVVEAGVNNRNTYLIIMFVGVIALIFMGSLISRRIYRSLTSTTR